MEIEHLKLLGGGFFKKKFQSKLELLTSFWHLGILQFRISSVLLHVETNWGLKEPKKGTEKIHAHSRSLECSLKFSSWVPVCRCLWLWAPQGNVLARILLARGRWKYLEILCYLCPDRMLKSPGLGSLGSFLVERQFGVHFSFKPV